MASATTEPGVAPAPIKAAGIPRDKSLRAWNFDANLHVDAAAVHALTKCEWVKKGCRCV